MPVAILVPLIVATWLHRILNVPYWTNVGFLLGGQIVAAVSAGAAATWFGNRYWGLR